MSLLKIDKEIPTFTLQKDPIMAGEMFSMMHFDGAPSNYDELLIPHRKDYYLLVFVRSGHSRHWVDTIPYNTGANRLYITVPNQLIVKEEIKPMAGTAFAFTSEFLMTQENASLGKLPLIQNRHKAHELLLSEIDIAFMEDIISKMRAEYDSAGEWQHRMVTAYLNLMFTYLSRLYVEQFKDIPLSEDRQLLGKYQQAIEDHFATLHQVSEYAAMLNVSAGHLSEVIKAQSGKSAIAHIQERLTLEARRLLFHSNQSLKEISFNLGFSEPSYFSRFFKRQSKQTPAEYRSTIRKMSQ